MICIRCGWKMIDHSKIEKIDGKIKEFTILKCDHCGHEVEI